MPVQLQKFTWERMIRAVEKATGKKVKLVESPRRAGDPPALYADSAKAQREFRACVLCGRKPMRHACARMASM